MSIAAYPAKFINASLVHFGNRSTRWLAKLAGEQFPYYYVSEHPRSGGAWAARMIADYLQVSFPWNPMLPLACPCVVHNHWAYSPRFRRVFYIYRDGRDVAVSTYFLGLNLKNAGTMVRSYRLRRLLGPAWDAPDAFKNVWKYLPAFIESWARRPFACPVNWPEHIDQWLGRPGVTPLRYEDLLQDCEDALSQALREHLGEEPDLDRVRWATEKFSFSRMSGRKPGQENRRSLFRKGVAGDWRNHFTREAAQVFEHYCGDTLRRLGYTQDKNWFEEPRRVETGTPASRASES